MERVGQRGADAGEHLELVDHERRLAAARLRGRSFDADDVAEVNLDLARALDVAHELDPAGAVDEVEEDELAHVAPRHHAAGETALRLGARAVLERLGLRADRRDLVAVGEPLRRGHAGECTGGQPQIAQPTSTPTPSAPAKSSQPETRSATGGSERPRGGT